MKSLEALQLLEVRSSDENKEGEDHMNLVEDVLQNTSAKRSSWIPGSTSSGYGGSGYGSSTYGVTFPGSESTGGSISIDATVRRVLKCRTQD